MQISGISLMLLMCLLTACNSSDSRVLKSKSIEGKSNKAMQLKADERFRQGTYHKSRGIRW